MIAVEDLRVRAGGFALDGVSFTVPQGEYGLLMGTTGSGKTTLLEAICGLRRVESGRIVLGGRDVTVLRPAERGVGFVPQDGALFATMTVREHLALALRVRRRPAAAIEARVESLARLLWLTQLLDRRPQGLSGGERQRVALGRALSFEPAVLCLDEPLSALDDPTREEICRLLLDVQASTKVTTLHITHNMEEARRLADRLFILRDGRVNEAELVGRRPRGGRSSGDGASVEENE